MDLVPMTGENFNAFLLNWCDLVDSGEDFSAFATAEANYMAVISLDLAILAVQDLPYPTVVEVPLPQISNDEVCTWANSELPEDWYSIPEIPDTAEIQQILADAMAAEGAGGSPEAEASPSA
jgi:hypothetical protein